MIFRRVHHADQTASVAVLPVANMDLLEYNMSLYQGLSSRLLFDVLVRRAMSDDILV